MKKYLLLFSLVIISLSSCKKGDIVSEQASVDDARIQAYIAANYSNSTTKFTKDPSGYYYSVITVGSGAPVTTTSTIQVGYTGKLLNGSTFDQAANLLTLLSITIQGWQLAIPAHLNDNGRLLLIVPSALAYGPTSPSSAIPANAVLVFNINMIGHY